MNNLLSQKWCLCLNAQNRIKSCHAKNHKFGDDTTVYIPVLYTRAIFNLLTIYKIPALKYAFVSAANPGGMHPPNI